MAEPYTPTTDEVRDDYAGASWRGSPVLRREAFERWLEGEREAVRAAALGDIRREAARAESTLRDDDGSPVATWLREFLRGGEG